jgi:AhpD family alkylhydroperoxidase
VLAHVPELLEVTMPFIAGVLGPSHLGERLKHLIVLRTSVINGCRYCTRVYRDTAGSAGISADESAALLGRDAVDAQFSSRERAAIAFVTAFCDDPAASVALLKADFRDDEIVALATIVGTTLFLNRFATAMGLA